MADCLSFDESFYICPIDECDPESLSAVQVDYTPAFNPTFVLEQNLEKLLPFFAEIDPQCADVYLMHHLCKIKQSVIAQLLGISKANMRQMLLRGEWQLMKAMGATQERMESHGIQFKRRAYNQAKPYLVVVDVIKEEGC